MMEELFDEDRIVPFFGTVQDLEELAVLVRNCLTVLHTATHLREMVIETWLTVDYAVRKFLLSGFELSRFCGEDFDLQFRLLPRDFQSLIDLLEYTVSFSRSLPLDEEPRKPDKIGGFRSSWEFWEFIREHYPELLERIREVEHRYRVEKNPELFAGDPQSALFVVPGGISPDQGPSTETIRLGWRQVACGLDSDWFARAKKLNRARNMAAHSFRVEAVARALGFSGSNVTALTRNECFQILQVLLGIRDEVIRA